MRKILLLIFLILIVFSSEDLFGQGAGIEPSGDFTYYRIDNAFYIQDDSTITLKNWTEKEMHVLFMPVRDSLIISIDIGGRDKVFFMGMAVKMENPGFVTSGTRSEFYHWIFTSHIKEGIGNAYILKEYVEGSLEKLGVKHYFINILFTDQTEFQLFGYEIKTNLPGKLRI